MQRPLHRNLIRNAIITICILLIPLVAMQFTEEVQWTAFDFVFMGTILFGTGLAYELVSRKANSRIYKIAVGIGVTTALFLVWINGAVGIIGTEKAPANALYFSVLAIGAIGALIARFNPKGMSYTLFTAAAVAFLIPIAASIIWEPLSGIDLIKTFVLSSGFAVLFAISGGLFRRAAKLEPKLG